MSMALRLAALLPRAVIVALIWVLATAAFTFAADSTIVGPSKPSGSTTPVAPTELIVPSVTGQAYVFAKGILEDSGFAWRVTGGVRGYSSNKVMTQSPAAGTRVIDTGAPMVVIRLVRGAYAQLGRPVDASSYPGTPIRLAGLAATTSPVSKPATAPKSKPVVKPIAKPAKPKAKPVVQPKRPPAFTPAGAPKEPLDEMTLPARAARLDAWVGNHAKTRANVQHWLYQHEWIVTGARFGWWHGAEALERLIRVDQRVEREWGIGGKSEALARSALVRVRHRAR